MSAPLDIRLSEASGVPFYRQIVDQVEEMIRSGVLPAGAPLPSVRELSAALLVSLITTRRAYSDLENLGLVTLKQGQGTFVAHGARARSQDETLAELRVALQDVVRHARALGIGAEQLEGIWAEAKG